MHQWYNILAQICTNPHTIPLHSNPETISQLTLPSPTSQTSHTSIDKTAFRMHQIAPT